MVIGKQDKAKALNCEHMYKLSIRTVYIYINIYICKHAKFLCICTKM